MWKLRKYVWLFVWLGCMPVQAAVGECKAYGEFWTRENLEPCLVNGQFNRLNDYSLVRVRLEGDVPLKYDNSLDEYNKLWTNGRIEFGSIANSSRKYTLSISAVLPGYRIGIDELRILMRSYADASDGQSAWCQVNNLTPVCITSNTWDDHTPVEVSLGGDTVAEITLSRTDGKDYVFSMSKLDVKYYVKPDAPTWDVANCRDTMHTSYSQFYWYDLKAHAKASLPLFSNTLQYEAIGDNASHVVWNSEHTQFYVTQPGEYQFRAYVEHFKGGFCSSEYSEVLTVYADDEGNNHVPFTIATPLKYNVIVTQATHANWRSEDSLIVFPATTEDHELTLVYSGIPDTLSFYYASQSPNAEGQVTVYSSVNFGPWQPLFTLSDMQSEEHYVEYALRPNVNRLRIVYSGSSQPGWLRALTVTERKEIVLRSDTLVQHGAHKAGRVVSWYGKLNWYNLLPRLSLSASGGDAHLWQSSPASIAVALDSYGENVSYLVGYKLDEPGIHYSSFVAQSGDSVPVREQFVLKGVTQYQLTDLKIDNPYTSTNTEVVHVGDTLAYPFYTYDLQSHRLQDSLYYTYSLSSPQIEMDSLGRIIPHCVGDYRVTAVNRANWLMPEIKEVAYIHVKESEPNGVDWHWTKSYLVAGDTIEEMATSRDQESVVSYSFVPSDGVQPLGNGQYVVGATPGDIQIVAHTTATCTHEARTDTSTMHVMGRIERVELNPANFWDDLQVGDSVGDLFRVIRSDGQVLRDPEDVHVSYTFSTDTQVEMQDSSHLRLPNAGEVTIYTITYGEGYVTHKDTLRFRVDPVSESVFWNLPETLWVDTVYGLCDYITTRTGQPIDTVELLSADCGWVYLDATSKTLSASQPCSLQLRVVAKGNASYQGPVEKIRPIRFISSLQPVRWTQTDSLYVHDTLSLDSIHIFGANGEDVTDEAQVTYTILPSSAAKAVDSTHWVVEQLDTIRIRIGVMAEGYMPREDTLVVVVNRYRVDRTEWPADWQDGQVSVGDSLLKEQLVFYSADDRLLNSWLQWSIAFTVDTVAYVDDEGDGVTTGRCTRVGVVVTATGEYVYAYQDTLWLSIAPLADPLQGLYQLPNEMQQMEQWILPTESAHGQTIYYQISDTAAVTIQEGLLQTHSAADSVRVVAYTTGNQQYAGDTMAFYLRVVEKPRLNDSIDWSVLPDTLTVGETYILLPNSMLGHVDITYETSSLSYELTGNMLRVVDSTETTMELCGWTNGNTDYLPVRSCRTFWVRDTLHPTPIIEDTLPQVDTCFHALVQLWRDVMVVNLQLLPSSMVVKRYVWYHDGQVLSNSAQSYQSMAGLQGAYWVEIEDTQGRIYRTCELTIVPTVMSAPVPLLQLYPNSVQTSQTSVAEVAADGQLCIRTDHGFLIDCIEVREGVNRLQAPSQPGVYIVTFEAEDGRTARLKWIVL